MGDGKDDINDKFCHYLYELQRSFLPVMFEVANQVINSDTRVQYFVDKRFVEYKKDEYKGIGLVWRDGKPMCGSRH